MFRLSSLVSSASVAVISEMCDPHSECRGFLPRPILTPSFASNGSNEPAVDVRNALSVAWEHCNIRVASPNILHAKLEFAGDANTGRAASATYTTRIL